MAADITMPSLGMTMEEGRVVEWRVKEGDSVTAGQILLDIESEKTAYEIEAPIDGIMGAILVPDDTTVPVGTRLSSILADGEATVAPPAAPAPEPVPVAVPERPAAAPDRTRMRATPRARRLAETLGINLATIIASGPDGMISESDVQAAAVEKPTDEPTTFTLRPLSSMRRVIAERMAESARTVPHFYLAVEVDGSALLTRRAAEGPRILAETGVKLTLTDLLLLITARTLIRHRALNASFTAEGIREWNAVDLGVAVALDDGLMVPVIRGADRKSLAEIVRARADLVTRAQAGTLTYRDTEAGTFTLSNLGSLGVDFFTSILNAPQAGILSVGSMTERPAVVQGAVVVRPGMTIGLTIDHRVTDGATGARFLADLRSRIESTALDDGAA